MLMASVQAGPSEESYCSSPSRQPVTLVYKEEEVELDPQVPTILTGASSSSPDNVVIPSSPSPPDGHCQYQKLLQRVASVL